MHRRKDILREPEGAIQSMGGLLKVTAPVPISFCADEPCLYKRTTVVHHCFQCPTDFGPVQTPSTFPEMRVSISLTFLLLVCVVPAFLTPQDAHHNKKVNGKHVEVHPSKDHHTDHTHTHGGQSAVKKYKKEFHPPKANALHGQEQRDHHQQQHPTKRNGKNKHEKHEKEDKDSHKKSVHRKGTPSQRRNLEKKAVNKPARSHKTNTHH